MTPERWVRMKEIFGVALELPERERDVYLDEACANDADLRIEIERLLAKEHNAELRSPVSGMLRPTPAPAKGDMLGRYRIEDKLGEGGMGVVYRAYDAELRRSVAIKMLPPDLASDVEGRHRLLVEARAASALNHPHICTLHDIGDRDGQPFLVMELLEGQTLQRRLAGAPLKTEEVLEFGIQMADALEAAHARGIIHRDIKPANIIITNSGHAKVLDFGLAKPAHRMRDPIGEGASQMVSMESDLTGSGRAMGTAAYMSPEQARGEELDARTDLFSLGCVLYEMTTGKPAFAGATAALIYDAVLNQAPTAANQMNLQCPPELVRLVNKALEKERDFRYQSAADLRSDLMRLKRDMRSGRPSATRPVDGLRGALVPAAGHHSKHRAMIALAGSALILIAGGAVEYRRLHKSRLLPMRVVTFTTFAGEQSAPSFSPDGNQIAFAWNGEKEDNWDIYVKLIGVEKPLRLTTDAGNDIAPEWSPDGRHIAFLRENENGTGIFTVPALGGPERKLRSLTRGASCSDTGPDWSPDGQYLAYVDCQPNHANTSIFLLAVDNPDDLRALTSPPGLQSDWGPRFSPDGLTVAFVHHFTTGNAADIYVVPFTGGEPKRITFDNASVGRPDWTPDGAYIVFYSNRLGENRLWKVPASGGNPEALMMGQVGACNPRISRDGHRLAYIHRSENADIWRYEVPRKKTPTAPPTKFIASTGYNLSQQFSPDGRRIVFESSRLGYIEIWVCDSDGSNPRQLTFLATPQAGAPRWLSDSQQIGFEVETGGQTVTPRWSPDSQQIAFDSEAGGQQNIYVVNADGGRPTPLTSGAANNVTPSWSRDGRWIYFASDRTGAWQTWKIPSAGGQPVQVTKRGGFAAFESFDGKTLYYAKGQSVAGLSEVPVAGGEEKPVLEQLAAGLWGYWALTAEGIYFYDAPTKAIEFFSFKTRKVAQVAKPEKPPVFYDPGLAVFPDGRSILFAQIDQSESHIMLVENFRW